MSRTAQRRSDLRGTVTGWIVASLGLIAALFLDTTEHPQKWHAAIMWTSCTFGGVLIICRDRWNSWRFWFWWAIWLVAHVLIMWLIFDKALAPLVVGTVYVVPPALVELVVLQRIMAPMRGAR